MISEHWNACAKLTTQWLMSPMAIDAPIDDLLRLQDKYGLFLYIDDAHGISIQGNRGEGYARSRLGASLRERTIVAASLSKGWNQRWGSYACNGQARQAYPPLCRASLFQWDRTLLRWAPQSHPQKFIGLGVGGKAGSPR